MREHHDIRITTTVVPIVPDIDAALLPGPITAELRYVTTDPLAVRITCRAGDVGTTRMVLPTKLISRSLLANGTACWAGEGDVRVGPTSAGSLTLRIRAERSWTEFVAVASDVVDFLAATYDLVPPGRELEWYDIDQELALLLDSA